MADHPHPGRGAGPRPGRHPGPPCGPGSRRPRLTPAPRPATASVSGPRPRATPWRCGRRPGPQPTRTGRSQLEGRSRFRFAPGRHEGKIHGRVLRIDVGQVRASMFSLYLYRQDLRLRSRSVSSGPRFRSEARAGRHVCAQAVNRSRSGARWRSCRSTLSVLSTRLPIPSPKPTGIPPGSGRPEHRRTLRRRRVPMSPSKVCPVAVDPGRKTYNVGGRKTLDLPPKDHCFPSGESSVPDGTGGVLFGCAPRGDAPERPSTRDSTAQSRHRGPAQPKRGTNVPKQSLTSTNWTMV